MLLFSLPILFYFPPPPQFFIFLPQSWIPFSSSILLFPLLVLILFYILFHPRPHRPYIDPPASPHSNFTLVFFNTASWIVKLYTTTTIKFLLFSSSFTTTTFLLFSSTTKTTEMCWWWWWRKTMEMWWWRCWRRKTIEMWWWWYIVSLFTKLC